MKIVWAIALASLAASLSAQTNLASDGASDGTTISNVTQQFGRAPLTLKYQQNLGYLVTFEDRPYQELYQSVLISINNTSLKGLSVDQINALLAGPVDSTLELEVLTEAGQKQKAKLTRRAVRMQPSPLGARPMLKATDSLDSADPRLPNIDFAGEQLDILARGSQNLLIAEAQDWPEPKGNLTATAALSAALTSYEVGALPQGDKYLTLAENSYIPGLALLPPPNYLPGDIIKTLLAVGREDDAERILHMLFDAKQRAEVLDLDLVNCLKILALAQRDSNKGAATATAERIEKLEKTGLRSDEAEWLAAFYAKLGDSARATELYGRAAANRADNAAGGQWQSLRPLAMDLYQLARVQAGSGKKQEAIASLGKAEELYSTRLPAAEIEALEQLPEFFPRPSDIRKLLTCIKQGKAPNTTDGAVIEADSSDLNNFAQLRSCYSYLALAQNDETLAANKAGQQLASYVVELAAANRGKSQISANQRRPLRMYCSILSLARAFSDKGFYPTSDRLLHQLTDMEEAQPEPDASELFLTSELVYNADKLRIDSKNLWEKLHEQLHLTASQRTSSTAAQTSPIPEYSWSERLRRLSMCFFYAGELSRAQFFIERAIKESENTTAPDAAIVRERAGAEAERILLLVDQACINAAEKHFKQADKPLMEIVALPAMSPRAYDSLAQLAIVYADNNQPEKGIALLRNMLGKPLLQVDRAEERFVTPASLQAFPGATLEYELAKLLYESGKTDEAAAVIGSYIKKTDNLGLATLALAADCAEKRKDYESAANYCLRALGTNEYGPMLLNTGSFFLPAYLSKVRTLIEKIAVSDRAKAAALCTQLAKIAQAQYPKEAETLNKRASELIKAAEQTEAHVPSP